MKSLFRFIITRSLALKARQYLKKHRPRIIAVTGSIGKTSAKEAIFTLLDKHFKVYRSKKGFNTPIGVSLAILQEEKSGFTSAKAWLKILKRAFFDKKESFEKMILEMGADQPGDLKKLVKIAPPHIAVITAIAPVHLDTGQFKDLDDIAAEKSTLIKSLTHSGVAVLNIDDPYIREMSTPGQKLTYGTDESAMVRATAARGTAKQLQFTVSYQGQSEEFKVPILGKFQIYVLLPAIAVALHLGMTLKECARALGSFKLPPGRMSPIEGFGKSMIIDSSYNASPASVRKALELLAELPAGRKIAALGTMNETGTGVREVHLDVGRQVAPLVDLLVTVGPEATTLKQGAVEAGLPEESVYTFLDSEEAGAFLKKQLKAKDLVLVKGSQNRVRMERLVKLIMARPDKAKELLCRQDEAWGKI